jgi:hypothetical protein
VEFVNLRGQIGKSQCEKPEIKWSVASVYVFDWLFKTTGSMFADAVLSA